MFDIMKTVGKTAIARPAVIRTRCPRSELTRLYAEIERTKCATGATKSRFEQTVGPTLVDYYIYGSNMVQLHYQFLLRRLRSQEDQYLQYYPPPGTITHNYIKTTGKTT